MNPLRSLLVAALFASASMPHALAADEDEEKPPPGAMALSTVLTQLEQQGYTPIIEVSLSDERWEVEAYKTGEKRELEVDPNSGEILSDKPAD
ncbi:MULTISPECIES: PepSY domain-containing protein [Microbulbifer]|uniref:PepSY domain-containing protein n=1 Tax=Microbulbifer TaxID=48073 RepID=UPI001E3438D6|nr:MULTISPECIES: PepSY domain-containing protein [Microbulbifer]UHQ56231.1 PepSY domain-containing protein [Microbulbifer sp. YPW16]